MIYGYARVSTKGQAKEGNSLDSQEQELRAHGAQAVFTDSFTGIKMDRPNLNLLLRRIETGDTLIVTKLDRFARSVSQASELITDLIDRGVTVHVLNLGILSNDSVSTLLRNVLLAFAQFERDMIVQRTQEGKAVAKQDPFFHDGRPKKYSFAQINHALDLLNSGKTYSQVESMTGISKSTLIRAKKCRENEQ